MNPAAQTLFARRRQSSTQAFTLIEILIVVAIVVILAGVLAVAAFDVLSSAEEKKTNGGLQTFGEKAESNHEVLSALVKPEKVGAYTSKDFRKALGISKGTSYTALNEVARSKLLAFLLAPTQDQWEKIVTKSNMRRSALIPETTSKDFLETQTDGFNILADAWGNPMTYELIQSVGAGTEVKVVLRSPGEDGVFGNDDDLNYSRDKGKYSGPYDAE